MTKYFSLLLALLFSFSITAQETESTVSAIVEVDNDELYDASQIGSGSIDVDELAEILTESAETDQQKAEAIYHWVTHNIAYNIKLYEDFRLGERDKKKGKRIRKSAMEEHNAGKVKKAIRNRAGICEDYALIVNSLCQEAGLETKVVKGYIRIDPSKLRSTGEKHVWNLVKIDGEWKAIDATYGAGYLDQYNDFVFDYDPNYFLSSKEPFSLNHLPRDTALMLTDTIMTRRQFKNFPIIGRGFFAFDISNYQPLQVMQEVVKGEEVIVTFTSPKKIGQFTVYKDKQDEYEIVKRMKKGDEYTIVIHTKNMNTGKVMLFGDRQLIAAYRLKVNKP
jgi:transglutaminase/protease-like cytokinesis protein 3